MSEGVARAGQPEPATRVPGAVGRAAPDPLAPAFRTLLLVGCLVLAVVVLLATCTIAPGWSVRPQVFTYTFFALLLVMLERCFRDGGRAATRVLWIAPLLFALWVNTHGGFPAGLAVLALYLG